MAAPSSNSRAETVELLLGLQSMRREVRASDPGLLINMSGYMRLSHAEHLVSSASTVLASHPLNDIEAVLDTLKLIIYDLLATGSAGVTQKALAWASVASQTLSQELDDYKNSVAPGFVSGVPASGGESSLPAKDRAAAYFKRLTAVFLEALESKDKDPAASAPLPPVPKRVPHVTFFGKVEGQDRGDDAMDPPRQRIDDLFWLRDDDRKDPAVLAHLKAENAYTEAVTAPFKPLEADLYEELRSHLKETDEGAPFQVGRHVYFHATAEGLAYKTHCRRPLGAAPGAPREVVLDENALAKGHAYMTVGDWAPSPSGNLVAYTVDTVGYETHSLKVRDMSAGSAADPAGAADEVVTAESDADVVWGADDTVLYYVTMDEAHRPYKLWRHVRGGGGGEPECLFTEEDELFSIGVEKTRSGRFVVLTTSSSETSEQWVVDLHAPASASSQSGGGGAPLRCVSPREEGVLYELDHRGDRFYFTTNQGDALNFKVVSAPVDDCADQEAWEEIPEFPYSSEIKVDSVLCFESFLAVFGRERGLTQVWLLTPPAQDGGAWSARQWTPPESAFEVLAGPNEVFEAKALRLIYSSLTTPVTHIDHLPHEGRDVTVKQTEVPGYDPSLYRTVRLEATAKDGTKVPISLVFRGSGDRPAGGLPAPLLLDGYGAYGLCSEPDFSFLRLPLLDRGMVFAIAHIRGGGEMGRHWYELEGKYLNKKNTFTDFCDCAQHLVDSGWTTPAQLACVGRSAGGLLMGAVMNLRPDLFSVCLAGVPFVDVLQTMADPSIPLTTGEWEEWGNPNEEEYFDYMLSYSPVDNVTAKAYPSILVTAGLHDPRVPYWEPAKWVAQLRKHNTGNKAILLKCELEVGHFSASDRYKQMRERAFEYAFLFSNLGMQKEATKE